jgi:predicted nucleic acid-binding Zn ribbon protein
MSDAPALTEKTLAVLDAISLGLLALWPILAILHFLFRPAFTIFAIDNAAWIAFGCPLFLSGLLRWLNEVTDTEAIGPYRLWTAAGTVALVLCMASSFIATPKMEELQIQLATEGISAQQQALLQKEHAKASNFSLQFLSIRAVLAVGMALGLKKLPRKKASSD